ncbi:MAG: hypothetical protein HY099_04105 [Nitrospirae bacterium]|nr:hypothetical protein [Nitrospirota bacterium]
MDELILTHLAVAFVGYAGISCFSVRNILPFRRVEIINKDCCAKKEN